MHIAAAGACGDHGAGEGDTGGWRILPVFLKLLAARSASGQSLTQYTNINFRAAAGGGTGWAGRISPGDHG